MWLLHVLLRTCFSVIHLFSQHVISRKAFHTRHEFQVIQFSKKTSSYRIKHQCSNLLMIVNCIEKSNIQMCYLIFHQIWVLMIIKPVVIKNDKNLVDSWKVYHISMNMIYDNNFDDVTYLSCIWIWGFREVVHFHGTKDFVFNWNSVGRHLH